MKLHILFFSLMNSLIFQNPCEFFQFFLRSEKYFFEIFL